MGRWRKGSRELEIKEDLIKRIEAGEKISKPQAIKDYFNANTDYKYLVAQRAINTIFGSVKRELKGLGEPFGALNDQNQHGIPKKKAEYEFMGGYRYKLVKGIINGSEFIIEDGMTKGLIKGKVKSEKIWITNGEELKLASG